MRQHLTALLDTDRLTALVGTVREQVAKNATRIALGTFFLFSSTEARWTMVEVYALAMPLLVGWYMIAKYRYLRWMAGAEQREAESKIRTEALLDEWYAPKPEQQTAAYFNWDGPYTVAGQPR